MQGIEKEPEKQATKTSQSFNALGLALNMGFTIAVPIVVLGIGGRLLDKHFGTSPWLLLAGFLLSVIISIILIYRTILPYLKS